jgi:SAM-dependent methyltransferase
MSDTTEGARSNYIHGSDPSEQSRLARLNDLLNQASLRELNLKGGERILDVGSGLAQLTRSMARVTGGSGRTVGIERDPNQLAEARRLALAADEAELVVLRPGDAYNLPLRDGEWGTFDLAHARFLLEHVSDPLAVVKSMVAAVRPGGRVVLADDDHDLLRLWPDPPGFSELWRGYVRTYDRLGNDPFIGRRLIALLHAAGAAPARNHWVFFGGCAGSPEFPIVVENLAKILVSARGLILETSHMDNQAFDDAIGAFEQWGRRPDAACWFAMSWAEGIRPAHDGFDGAAGVA